MAVCEAIFQSVCAKVEDGSPCCDWVGENGAGHFVKMVHNGIEYGDMQLICEAYQTYERLASAWVTRTRCMRSSRSGTRRELDSYLIEITRDILGIQGRRRSSTSLIKILDTAGQKGTGKWTGVSSPRSGRACAGDAHRRGRVRALPLVL